jgi:hydroxyethylthiazole kinase-like uncharacterized protein yjeF
MAGAAMLSAMAAQRGGAGYVAIAGVGPGGPSAIVRRDADLAEMIADPRVGAVVIGPGLGRDAGARALLDKALSGGKPLVLDADALVLMADSGVDALHDLPIAPVLTPHDGEFKRLFGDLTGSRIERVRAAAARSRSVVVLKGADTVVAEPSGRAAIAVPAPAWLASAGTGDVLAGVIAACLARGMDGFDAAQAGIWLHAEAAREAGPDLIADDLIPALRIALAACG